MKTRKLIAIGLLTTSVSLIVGLMIWNFFQSRFAASNNHRRWVERVSGMVLRERVSATPWMDELPKDEVPSPRSVARRNSNVVAVYVMETRTHETTRWVKEGADIRLQKIDPRLVLVGLKAAQTKTTQLGPVLRLNQVLHHTFAWPLKVNYVVIVVQQLPLLSQIIGQESRLWHLHTYVYDFEEQLIFATSPAAQMTASLSQVFAAARTGRSEGNVDINRSLAWTWLGTFHYVKELDWVFILAEPISWGYAPFLAFLLGLCGVMLLSQIPWRQVEELRRAHEIQELSQFAQRVERFVRGQDAALNDPPYPFKELSPIVHTMRWLMPHWKKAEAFPKELATERKLLSLLIESLPEGILFFNPQGQLSLGNELGKVFLALQQETGREYKMVSGIQVPRGFLEPFADPVFTGAQKNLGKEVEVGWADGRHLYRVWVEAVEIDGQSVGFIVVVRDITFRKQWEYVQEQLLSGITHDLRGPLSAVMGYLDLLKRQLKEGPPKAIEYTKLAHEAGVRLTQMVSDILDVVRFEQGKIDIQLEAISVDEIFKRIQNIFGVMAGQKNVTLKLVLPQSGWKVAGDPKLLERVLDNLVGNAIKFTPSHGTITVSVRRDKTKTVFEVTDTGRGIPKEAQSRIFDKFQQVRPGDRSAGYGLGLAVAKFIVEAHKGEIWVESEVGQGSHFTFWIPDQPIPNPVVQAMP